jgi:hypothetical protein
MVTVIKEFSIDNVYTYNNKIIGNFSQYIGVYIWGDYYYDGQAVFTSVDNIVTILGKAVHKDITEVMAMAKTKTKID